MFEKVCEILADTLGISASDITMDTDIMTDLNADSLDIIEFITGLEDEYGVMIPQDSVANVRTVKQVVELMEELVG